MDLVRRGFYTGMEIQRADGFVVQTGKPEGDVSGLPAGRGRAVVLCAGGRFCGAGMRAGQVLSSTGADQSVSAVLASVQPKGFALVVQHRSACCTAPLTSAAAGSRPLPCSPRALWRMASCAPSPWR